jgi:hypothetical protein
MRSFLCYFACCCFVLLLLVSTTSFVVDPAGFFHYRGIHLGDAAHKKLRASALTVKSLALPALNPRVVIIGTSRVALGYDIASFESDYLPADRYNLGLPGMTMEEAELLIRELGNKEKLRDLFVALDYGMFTMSRPPRDEFTKIASGEDSYGSSILGKLMRYKFALFSPKVMKSILFRARNSPDLSGFWTRESQHASRSKGHRVLTHRAERAKVAREPQQFGYERQLESFRRTLKVLGRMPVRKYIFVNPAHVRRLVLFTVSGQQQRYISWLDDMIREVCEQPADTMPMLTVFSGVNKITTEPFPPLGDKNTQMQWYWESNHFKPATGVKVLESLTNPRELGDDFGKVLTCNNRKQFLAMFEKQWNDYIRENPDIVAEISHIMNQASSNRPTRWQREIYR